MLKVKRLNDRAILPTKNNKLDAGFDLYSIDNFRILGGRRASIHTGIALEIPDYSVGLIWPRSGMAVKGGIDVLAGVIDSTYRGEIVVCLFNTSRTYFDIHEGDKIAQIIIQQISTFCSVAKEVSELSTTERADKGFGSSGR